MKTVSTLILVLTFAVVAEVDPLSDLTVEEKLRQSQYVVINFYSPHCGVCADFAKELVKASEDSAFEGIDIKFFKIDATKEQKSVALWQVQGFHRVLMFNQGNLVAEYEGEKLWSQVVAWVKINLNGQDLELLSVNS